jgi:hypothetical protein
MTSRVVELDHPCHDGGRARRTSWRMAAVRPPWTGMLRALRGGPRLRGCMGCPARRPGDSQRASRLVAVAMFVLLPTTVSRTSANRAGMGTGGLPSRRWPLAVDVADVVNGETDDAPHRLRVQQQKEPGDPFVQRCPVVSEQPADKGEAAVLRYGGGVVGVPVRQPDLVPVGVVPPRRRSTSCSIPRGWSPPSGADTTATAAYRGGRR